MSDNTLFNDPGLAPFAPVIKARKKAALELEGRLIRAAGSLSGFADYHAYFGLGFDVRQREWVFREWAPYARDMYILCHKTRWRKDPLFRVPKQAAGVFEARFPEDFFSHRDLFRLRLFWPGGGGDRIPTAARRVVQDPETLIFNAQVWQPPQPYAWQVKSVPETDGALLIYEAHPGMALEAGRVGTWAEFESHILPKIVHAGYTALQLMAVQEHPYYGSLGYHVSSFFAPSSRFGTPEELKSLIDAAHGHGLRVFMDIVHSHGVSNEVEGLSRFDGTLFQFFHEGERGFHRLWDSRCFDYEKRQVLRFLLSNLRYWLEEFRVDGFRFDGITSMLFTGHGLGRAFTRYDDYFGGDVDTPALSYLYLANRLVHETAPHAQTIAEDVSGYPGLAASAQKGGVGFDFRFAMGIADHWIKLLKDVPDEHWDLGRLWHELTTRRKEEAVIAYAECHDQALVGDKTMMMHLMGGRIYTAMHRGDRSMETFRAVALHKMIRLITACTAHKGYLNFMGNEFGHPEWIDFPSPKNGFSFDHARRQWSLKYDPTLYFACLFEFDRQMTSLIKNHGLYHKGGPTQLYIHGDDKLLALERGGLVMVFNFHPVNSFDGYPIPAPPGKYRMVLDTDEERFGGPSRLSPGQVHFTSQRRDGGHFLSLYLPSRCALVLEPAGATGEPEKRP